MIFRFILLCSALFNHFAEKPSITLNFAHFVNAYAYLGRV
jgi:hypothetical protein